MSKTTAAVLDGVIATLPVDEPFAGPALLDGHDLADEDRVVAGVVARPEAALDPGQRLGEQRRSRLAGPRRDAVPEDERRHAAREVRRDVGLVAAKDGHAEGARRPQELVERELAPDRDS